MKYLLIAAFLVSCLGMANAHASRSEFRYGDKDCPLMKAAQGQVSSKKGALTYSSAEAQPKKNADGKRVIEQDQNSQQL